MTVLAILLVWVILGLTLVAGYNLAKYHVRRRSISEWYLRQKRDGAS